jgi:hypothetical protein
MRLRRPACLKNAGQLPKWFLLINRFRLTVINGKCPEKIFRELFDAVQHEMNLADKGTDKE